MANVSVFTAKDVAHIDKLTGANFQVWKFQICLMLRNHSLMDLVLGTEVKPDPVVASDVTTNQAATNSWNHKDNTAQLLISATICSDQQRSLIPVRLPHKCGNVSSFLNYQCKEGYDISSHVTAVELMASQLQDVGSPIYDDQIITKVASTLLPSYRHVIAAWENLDVSRKTINLLRARL
ncbi:hypothetical protein GHT06_019106 [Daphnia sinensis]|uniref:Copia protein n=1 Tax=Daphnia sinensis TaxID=1820382 RepID=A0AAD5KKV0_9CRUS|nr:hypothetical protein GHT06_019106 [Daphnia sinensis]